MKRLTKWIDDGEKRQAIPDPEIKSNGHCKCCNKLAETEDLEEQGRLLRLPCKVGDSVYRFGYADGKAYKVQKLVIRTLANLVAIMESGEFGKSVFLSLEEAGNKLNKMEENQ